MNTSEPSRSEKPTDLKRRRRRYEREHHRIVLKKRTAADVGPHRNLVDWQKNPWIVACACGWDDTAPTQERAKHSYTKHKTKPKHPRREVQRTATPVKNAPELPKKAAYFPYDPKNPPKAHVTRCMYCDAVLTHYTGSRNNSMQYRRQKRRRPSSHRNGIVCKNKTQCRRNRRAGGVGSYFKRQIEEDDDE